MSDATRSEPIFGWLYDAQTDVEGAGMVTMANRADVNPDFVHIIVGRDDSEEPRFGLRVSLETAEYMATELGRLARAGRDAKTKQQELLPIWPNHLRVVP